MAPRPLLVGSKGCGSMIVEAALTVAGIEYDYDDVSYDEASSTRPQLLQLNPLGQVPVLRLPTGELLTESLAMINWIDDCAPQAQLVPSASEPTRAAFLRWSVYLVAAVYPTFTYGDDPARWVGKGAAADALRESTDRQRNALWQQLDAVAGAHWFLGERFSAIDLYLSVMTWWRPGKDWFAAQAPKLHAIANRALTLPAVAQVFSRHYS